MGDERGDIGREFGIKRWTRRKVKDGNVSSRIRSCDSDLFSLISHLCLPPPPHSPAFTPPSSAFRALSLCRTCIYFPLFLTPSPFHTLQSLTSENGNGEGEKKKTSHAQFWCTACQACFECAHTAAYTRITPAYSQGNNRIKEYPDKAEKGGE